MSNIFVVCMGVGTVFVGLVSLIIICKITSGLCKLFIKDKPVVSASPVMAAASEEIPNRQEFVAAVAAAIAEDLGTDISGIRIHSIKKL